MLTGSTNRRIDVHHHYMSQAYLDTVGPERVASQGSARKADPWTAELSLEFMDAAGIGTALLSVSSPGIEMPTVEQTRRLARQSNEAIATMVVDHPGRFGLFAILPLPDIETSLAEAEFAFDALSADGVVLMSNYDGIYLGSPIFWPLFEELNRRHAVVLVHPSAPKDFIGFPGVSLSTLEFPFDTARAITSMLFHGTSGRFPNVTFIWSHAGGAMPYLVGRTAILSARNPDFQLSGPDRLLPAMRRFYFDLTQSTHPATLRAILEITTPDHLLFGSDCPFAKQPQVKSAIDDLEHFGLDDVTLEAIARQNALKLFARLRSRQI